MIYESSDLVSLKKIAFDFCSQCELQAGATLVTLSGDLGAGKTSFVQLCAEYFAVQESITSPTFVIQKEYPIPTHSVFKTLVHIDAYRLEGIKQLEYLGWHRLQQEPTNIIFLEWPEQVPEVFAQQSWHISFEILKNNTRRISIE